MPSAAWPALAPYEQWAATCDTLHAHAQVLGKLAAALAPPERDFQHVALRLTARGWETLPLPAPDGSGALVVALDLHTHHVVVEHSGGVSRRVALMRDRTVGAVTRRVLTATRELAGPVHIDPTPQEVSWTVPLDADEEHATYDPHAVGAYFQAATRAALVLGALRATHPGRSTPVNAWWGSFDLAVSLFAERPAESDAHSDAGCELAVGWWPGDARYPRAAFYAYARPASDAFAQARLDPPQARWDAALGEHLLDHDAVAATADPLATALAFGRSAQLHSPVQPVR